MGEKLFTECDNCGEEIEIEVGENGCCSDPDCGLKYHWKNNHLIWGSPSKMTSGEEAVWAAIFALEMKNALKGVAGEQYLAAIKKADDTILRLRDFLVGRYQTTDIRQRAKKGITFAYEMTGLDSDYEDS